MSTGWGRASGGFRDPMIRPLREAELEPVRVVVELTREQFEAIDKTSRRLGAPAFLRVVALKLAGSVPERGERLVEEPLGGLELEQGRLGTNPGLLQAPGKLLELSHLVDEAEAILARH